MDNNYDYPVNNYDTDQYLEMQRYNNRYDNRNDYDRMYDNYRRYDNRHNRYDRDRYDYDRYYRYPYCDRYGNCQNPIWWMFWPLFFL